MKKCAICLTLFFVVAGAANAQTFVATPNDSVEGTYTVSDWASDFIYLGNNSGSPLTLSFQTISNTITPAGWNVVLCTNAACFPYVPSAGSLGTIANGDSAYLHVQCGFMGIAGSNQIRVRVFETGNPANADTITFLYHANSTIGIDDNSSATNALSQNFPNPFSSSTTIRYTLNDANGTLVVTDVSGKVISEHQLNNPAGEITLGNLSSGIYFYSLYSNDVFVSRRKMIVQ